MLHSIPSSSLLLAPQTAHPFAIADGSHRELFPTPFRAGFGASPQLSNLLTGIGPRGTFRAVFDAPFLPVWSGPQPINQLDPTR